VADALEAGLDTDGLVAASDVIAMSAMRALSERGLSVPGAVAVVGYDDVSLAAFTTPPLTTIRQELDAAAMHLVDLLFRRIDGEETASISMPPRLMVRGSA
jgi:DNA-binding LacI/PurR family transcriptional regulator